MNTDVSEDNENQREATQSARAGFLNRVSEVRIFPRAPRGRPGQRLISLVALGVSAIPVPAVVSQLFATLCNTLHPLADSPRTRRPYRASQNPPLWVVDRDIAVRSRGAFEDERTCTPPIQHPAPSNRHRILKAATVSRPRTLLTPSTGAEHHTTPRYRPEPTRSSAKCPRSGALCGMLVSATESSDRCASVVYAVHIVPGLAGLPLRCLRLRVWRAAAIERSIIGIWRCRREWRRWY